MSDLNRLRELAALFQPRREPVVEAASPHDSLKGIKAVVDDALDDLVDKLGKGGVLEHVLKDNKLHKLDVSMDGKDTIMATLAKETREYIKKVQSLLDEIEIIIVTNDTDK